MAVLVRHRICGIQANSLFVQLPVATSLPISGAYVGMKWLAGRMKLFEHLLAKDD